MGSYYYNELPAMPTEEGMVALGMIILGILGVILLFALVFWIIRSMSLHRIARRRGIRHAWLAWIPIGGQWILRSLSDQYQHLVQGRITSRRKLLLVLAAAGTVLGSATTVIPLVQDFLAATEQIEVMWGMTGTIPAVIGWCVGAASLVFYHICNYDLYRSCNPQNAVVFLVVGILLPVTEPFFYLACRKKDMGMNVSAPVTCEPAELPWTDSEF